MDALPVSERDNAMKASTSEAAASLPPSKVKQRRASVLRMPVPASQYVVSVATVVGLITLWIVASRQAWVKPLFLPPPEAIVAAFQQALNGDLDGAPLWSHLAASLLRVMGAFALAAFLGIPLGLAMGVNRVARGIFDPIIEFYRPLPPLAYLPLMIIWFGINEASKVLLIFLACFAPVALAARAGVLSASRDQINAARSMGASRAQVLLHVVLPAALPEILVGLRIGMGVGWTTFWTTCSTSGSARCGSRFQMRFANGSRAPLR